VSDVSRKHRLHDICAIETVHAVSADSSALCIHEFAGAWGDLLDVVKALLKIAEEVVKSVKLFLDNIDELREVLPLHLTALVMEIKPHVFYELVLHLIHYVCKVSTYAQL
jgi:hypothetical protein